MGWGPATCTVLQGVCPVGTLDWDISLPFLLMQEIHVTCDHLSLLPETMSFCLVSSKTAHYFSVPLFLKAWSTVSDPLLVFAELCREEGQGYLNVYILGCNGLMLPADIFISVQVQGQILFMSGICELLLYIHTFPSCARFATSCLQEIKTMVNQPYYASLALLPLFWLMLLGCLFCVRQEHHRTRAVLSGKTHYLAKHWMHRTSGRWTAEINPQLWADPSI